MSARIDEVEQYIYTLTIAELEQLPAGIDADALIIAELRRRDTAATPTPTDPGAVAGRRIESMMGRPGDTVRGGHVITQADYLARVGRPTCIDEHALMLRAEGLALAAIGGQP